MDMTYKISDTRKTLILSRADTERTGRNCRSWHESVGMFKTYGESSSAFMKQVFIWSIEFINTLGIDRYKIIYSEIEEVK